MVSFLYLLYIDISHICLLVSRETIKDEIASLAQTVQLLNENLHLF